MKEPNATGSYLGHCSHKGIESDSSEPKSGRSRVNPDGEVCANNGRNCGSKKLVLTLLFATIDVIHEVAWDHFKAR
ncbi:hypothetical protein [Paraglaciecola sp. MB-3u-78]|uniref:hypothetical protein n=1 Tax=Paraglaciecola sp. MB-3u-78 TaxID=2058332 RepID=UPI0018E31F7A|nr:hypothetical protein [Paraglaciecola sp. MB-3u-78]